MEELEDPNLGLINMLLQSKYGCTSFSNILKINQLVVDYN